MYNSIAADLRTFELAKGTFISVRNIFESLFLIHTKSYKRNLIRIQYSINLKIIVSNKKNRQI